MNLNDKLGNLIAHLDHSTKRSPHLLSSHLDETGLLAGQFAELFYAKDYATIAGFAHDLGKARPDFQVYIGNPSGKRGSVKHALPGAYLLSLARHHLPETHLYLAYLLENIVAGHHRGLYDMSPSYFKKYKDASDIYFPSHIKLLAVDLVKKLSSLPNETKWNDPVYLAALTRFTLSAVVDADWLDTERYFTSETTSLRDYKAPSWESFQKDFQRHTAKLSREDLSRYREQARQHGKKTSSFFEINLPTGYGKTYASLAFALEHAKTFSKSRVIVALPLINLTAELSASYRSLFGDEHVIEDHSAFRTEQYDKEESPESRLHLATENYDRPFVITTTVQLFESLFSNRPAKLRKIHRLAGSILILDEYHLLPGNLLAPILQMLDVLQKYFGVTVLLVSATPLPFTTSKRIQELGLQKLPVPVIEEIDPPRKVKYMHLGIQDEQALVQKLTDVSTLIIVNTRKRAQQLYGIVKTLFPDRPVFYLSTTLVANDRANRLEDIKQSLEEKPIVISTSLLEAGVDISFHHVYREMAPLPSIIQAAGRCNRDGKLEYGKVFLFEWSDPIYHSPSIRSGIDQVKNFLDEHGLDIFFSREALSIYYSRKLTIEMPQSPISDTECLHFETVAKRFRMIDSQGITVICPEAAGFEQHWLSEPKTRDWWRKVQPYTAQAPSSAVSQIIKIDKVPVWKNFYDPQLGILL